MYEEDDEELLDEIRVEKANLRSVLNKKKLTKWEMDEALTGEI
jgi:hypothetical protein